MSLKPTKASVEAAINQNKKTAARIKTQAALGNIKEWGHVAFYGPTVSADWAKRECSYAFVLAFLADWVNRTEERMMEAYNVVATGGAVKLKIDKSAPVWRIGDVTLFPEQAALANAMWESKERYVYSVDEPGAGKTYAFLGLVDKFIKSGALDKPENIWRLVPILILSPATVVEQTKRVFVEAGYGKLLGTKIHVQSYNFLQTAAARGRMWKDIENIQTGQYEIRWTLPYVPLLLICDEAHRLMNLDTEITRIMIPLLQQTRAFGFTATPADTLEKLRTLLIANRTQFDGITANDAAEADKLIRRFDTNPHLPNVTAMARIREVVVGKYLYSMPKVKWPFRARNRNIVTDFACEADREYYRNALVRYQEKCRQLRKKTSKNNRFAKAVAVNEFRRAVEPLRAPFIVDRILHNWRTGTKATIVGCAYKETMIRIAFLLDEAGFPVEKEAAFIWGAVKRFKPELVYTQEEIKAILKKIAENPFESIDKTTEIRLRESIRFHEDRIINQETAEQQTARHARLKELGLFGGQTRLQRQRQIDKFQQGAGCALAMFTLAAGGTGLSLHHNSVRQLPRETYLTPTYNGPEIKQALGRGARRTSLSDTDQYLCWMRGTVEESEVAPRIDAKLHCLAELTNRNFDITDLLESEVNPLQPTRLRTFEEIAAAEGDNNNQLVDTGDDDDDDDNMTEEAA